MSKIIIVALMCMGACIIALIISVLVIEKEIEKEKQRRRRAFLCKEAVRTKVCPHCCERCAYGDEVYER